MDRLDRMEKMIEENIKRMREIQETHRKFLEEQKKTDAEIRKTHEQIKILSQKTDAEIYKVSKLVAGISDGFGRMTEGFALASIEEVFKGLGIYIYRTLPRAKSRKNGKEVEFDLVNLAKRKEDKKELVLLTEVKTYLRIKDVDGFKQNISKFYEFFEEYRARELIGIIAFMNYVKGAKEYAEKNGFYLLFCSEDLMKLSNTEGFKPKLWRYA